MGTMLGKFVPIRSVAAYAFYKFGRIFIGTDIIAIMVTIVAISHLSIVMRGHPR
jgi:hypothetical protein